jgi:hypothetical protein
VRPRAGVVLLYTEPVSWTGDLTSCDFGYVRETTNSAGLYPAANPLLVIAVVLAEFCLKVALLPGNDIEPNYQNA